VGEEIRDPSLRRGREMVEGHFWHRGYCVNTAGLNEETIRKCIREEEALEKRQRECDFAKQGKLIGTFPHLSSPRGRPDVSSSAGGALPGIV